MVEPRNLKHVIPVKFTYLTSLSVWVSSCGAVGTGVPAPASKQAKLYQCKTQGDVNTKTNAGCVAQLEERPNSDPRKSPLKEPHGGSILNWTLSRSGSALVPETWVKSHHSLLATSAGDMVTRLKRPLPQLVLLFSFCIPSLEWWYTTSLVCFHVQGSNLVAAVLIGY